MVRDAVHSKVADQLRHAKKSVLARFFSGRGMLHQAAEPARRRLLDEASVHAQTYIEFLDVDAIKCNVKSLSSSIGSCFPELHKSDCDAIARQAMKTLR